MGSARIDPKSVPGLAGPVDHRVGPVAESRYCGVASFRPGMHGTEFADAWGLWHAMPHRRFESPPARSSFPPIQRVCNSNADSNRRGRSHTFPSTYTVSTIVLRLRSPFGVLGMQPPRQMRPTAAVERMEASDRVTQANASATTVATRLCWSAH